MLSFSAIDCFSFCERKYWFEWVVKVPEEPSIPLVVGNVYHDVLAFTYTIPGSTLEDRIERAMAEADADLTALGVNKEDLRDELWSNVAGVLRLHGPSMFQPVPLQPGVPFVERRFCDEELGYCGVLDLLSSHTPVVNDDGRVVDWRPEWCVVDWKTTSSQRRRTDRSARVSAQLALYAIEAQVFNGVYVEIPRNVDKPLNVRVARYSVKDLNNWRKYLVNMRDAILSRGDNEEAYHMAAPDNPLCCAAYCRHFSRCFDL